MQILRRTWNPIWAVAGIIAGIVGLMTIEIIEEPDMTLGQILMELAEPVLIVLAVREWCTCLDACNVSTGNSSR